MGRIIAVILLALALGVTGVVGLFSIMSASSPLLLITMTISPTAILPVAYFLVAHGILGDDADDVVRGIGAAIAIFIANVAVFFIGHEVGKMVDADAANNSPVAIFILLIACVLCQVILFLFFRRRLSRHKEKLSVSVTEKV